MPQLFYHLQVIVDSFFYPFGFQIFPVILEKVYLLDQVILDLFNGRLHPVFRCNKNIGRIDKYLFKFFQCISINRIERGNLLNLVPPENKPIAKIMIGEKHIHVITANPERTLFEVDLIPGIHAVNQFPK